MLRCGNLKRSSAYVDLHEKIYQKVAGPSKKTQDDFFQRINVSKPRDSNNHTKNDDLFKFDMCEICHTNISNFAISRNNKETIIETCHNKDCINKANNLLS